MNKAAYVRKNQQHDGTHRCHWPGCQTATPPSMWGCRMHWFALPKRIRGRIWRAYRPGQEKTKDPSREYLDAVMEADRWIEQNYSAEATHANP